MGGIHQRAESGDFGEILPHQLIEQAAITDLEFGLLRIFRAHIADGGRGDLVFGDAAHLLNIVVAVEEVRIDPLAAGGEELVIIVSGVGIAEGMGHLFGGAQRAQVIDAAERIRSVEFDVVGVVLDAIEDAAAARIPSAVDPGEGEGALHARAKDRGARRCRRRDANRGRP